MLGRKCCAPRAVFVGAPHRLALPKVVKREDALVRRLWLVAASAAKRSASAHMLLGRVCTFAGGIEGRPVKLLGTRAFDLQPAFRSDPVSQTQTWQTWPVCCCCLKLLDHCNAHSKERSWMP